MIGQQLYHDLRLPGISPSLLARQSKFLPDLRAPDPKAKPMTETLNTFDYLKTAISSFAILAGLTISMLCLTGQSF